MRNSQLSVPAIALLTLIVIACAEDDTEVKTGDLQVTYQVGSGTSSCEDAGISFVRVYVSISETEDLVDEIIACDPSDQSVVLKDIKVGTYTVRAEGLNGDNDVIYNGAASGEVTVEEDQTNGPARITFNQVRPSIEIYFDFDGAGGCDRFEVVDIVVVLYQDSVSQMYDETFECASQLNAPLVIGDLSSTSTYDIRVRGTNENDEFTYEYNEDGIQVAPGPATEISAVMAACSGLCDAP